MAEFLFWLNFFSLSLELSLSRIRYKCLHLEIDNSFTTVGHTSRTKSELGYAFGGPFQLIRFLKALPDGPERIASSQAHGPFPCIRNVLDVIIWSIEEEREDKALK